MTVKKSRWTNHASEKLVNRGLALPPSYSEILNQIAKENGMSFNALVRTIIEDYLQKRNELTLGLERI